MGISITENFEVQVRGLSEINDLHGASPTLLPPCGIRVASELKGAFQNHPPAFPPLYLFTYF